MIKHAGSRYLVFRGPCKDEAVEIAKNLRDAICKKFDEKHVTVTPSIRQGDLLAEGVTALVKLHWGASHWHCCGESVRKMLPEGVEMVTYEERPLSPLYEAAKASEEKLTEPVWNEATNFEDDFDDDEEDSP